MYNNNNNNVYIYIYLCIYISIYLSLYLSISLSLYLSISLSLYLETSSGKALGRHIDGEEKRHKMLVSWESQAQIMVYIISIYLSICLSIYLSICVCVFVCIIWYECMYTNSLYKLRLIERALRAVWAFAEIYWDLQESFFSVRVQDEMLMYMPAARSAKFSFIFGKSRLAMAKP